MEVLLNGAEDVMSTTAEEEEVEEVEEEEEVEVVVEVEVEVGEVLERVTRL